LIKSSAIMSLMSKYLRIIFFRFIISLIQYQRISMCFVLLWYSELMMKSIAFLLSAKISTNWSSFRNFSSWRNCLIQIASLAVSDRVIYSVSQDDNAMMNCCLDEWLIVSSTSIKCLFIDPGMKRDHVLSTWSRRTTHWTLNRTLISRSSVLTSFRKIVSLSTHYYSIKSMLITSRLRPVSSS
jgi:hypothetical protein